MIGAVPYAAVGIYGDVTRGESRLLFPSQFGVLLLMATAIQLIPWTRLRAAMVGGVIVTFALSMAHDFRKWLVYDGLVTTDITRQVRAAVLADSEPKVVELKIVPSSWTLLFRRRCLGAADMNVAQMILRDDRRQPSLRLYRQLWGFLQSRLCACGTLPPSYIGNHYSCPAHRETWQYQATPGIPPLDEIGLLDLISSVNTSTSMTAGRGQLARLIDGQPTPLARSEYRPPCHRPGVKPLLWLFAAPPSTCE